VEVVEVVTLVLRIVAVLLLIGAIVWTRRFSSRFPPRKKYDMERQNAERYWKYFDGSQLP
jgi:hypothetical protein